MTEKQKVLYDAYFQCNRDRKEIAKKLGYTRRTVDQYLTRYWVVQLAIEVNDMEAGVLEKIDNPTLEWTLQENMRLYQHAEREFIKFDEMCVKNDFGDGTINLELRDRYKKDMREMLKQITDHQNKFGEMLNNDTLEIGKMTTKELIAEYKKLNGEVEKFLSKEKDKWNRETYLKEK
jgi:hypothetical protein